MVFQVFLQTMIGAAFSGWFFFVGFYRSMGYGDAVKGYSKIYGSQSLPFKGDVTFPKFGGLLTNTRLEWVAILFFLSVFASFVFRSEKRAFSLRTATENILLSTTASVATLVAIHFYIQSFVRGPGF